MIVLHKLMFILGLNIISGPCSLFGSLVFEEHKSSPIIKSIRTAMEGIASATNAHPHNAKPEELNMPPDGGPVTRTGSEVPINGNPVPLRTGMVMSNVSEMVNSVLKDITAENRPEHRESRNDHRRINFNENPQAGSPINPQAVSPEWRPNPNVAIPRPTLPPLDGPPQHRSQTTTGTSVFILNPNSKNTTTEGKILNPSLLQPSRPDIHNPPTQNHSPSNQNNLCKLCLCSDNRSIVQCSHNHSENNTHVMILDANMIPKKTQKLLIQGYESIEVRPQALGSSPELKEIIFEDIDNLVLVPNSLFFSSESSENKKVFLKFKNCNIATFPEDALTQNVEGRHEHKDIFANERRRYMSIEFKGCKIGVLEKNSLRRARIYNFYVLKTTIKNIMSNAIDLDVSNEVKFEGNILPFLPTKAICLHASTTVFASNHIQRMENRSIVTDSDHNVFDKNTIDELRTGALAGIETPNNRYGSSIKFTNNHLKKLEPKSLTFGSSYPLNQQTFENNVFYIDCECDFNKTLVTLMGTKENETNSFQIALKTSSCLNNNSSRKFIYVGNFLYDECTPTPFPTVIVTAVSVAILLFIITVTVCVVCSLRVQQVKEEANMLGECTSQSFSTLSRNYNDTLRPQQPCDEHNTAPFAVLPWGVAFPEIKTYQLHQTPEFTEQTESICGSARGSMKDRRSELFTKYPDRSSCPFN